MSKFNNATQRMVFDNAAAIIDAAGYSVQNAVLTPSFVRAEALMNTTASQFNLPILTNQNQQGTVASYPTENKIQQTDAFLISDMCLYVCKPSSATDTNFILYTYGNLTAFSSSNTAASIDAAYCNGQLQILVNNRNILPAYDLARFWRVPRTQANTNTLVSYSGATTVTTTKDSVDFSQDGRDPFEPNMVLAGNDNPSVRIVLPGTMTAVESTARFVWMARGILAQNVSKIAGTRSN